MRGVAKFLAACLVAECLLSKCAQDQAGQSLPAPDGAGGIPGWRGEAKPASPPGEAMESTEVVAPIPDRDDIPDFRLRAALKSAGEDG